MKKRIIFLVLLLSIIIISIINYKPKIYKWSYSLPNHYYVGKIDKDNVILGKYVNNKLTIEKDGKIIGISEYIEAFSYQNNYIFIRSLTNDNELKLNYYIVDSKLEVIYGRYDLDAFNEKVSSLELSNDINWLKSADFEKDRWENI